MKCRVRIDRRWFLILVMANAPLFSGAWVFSYPIDNERVHTTATGTGTADPSVTARYEIVFNGVVDDFTVGTSNAGGGWYLTIAGPLQVGTGRTAYLKDGSGAIKDTSTNITVSNTP